MRSAKTIYMGSGDEITELQNRACDQSLSFTKIQLTIYVKKAHHKIFWHCFSTRDKPVCFFYRACTNF